MTEQFKKIFIITLLLIPLALCGEENYQKVIIEISPLSEDYLSSLVPNKNQQQIQATYADIVAPLNQEPPSHLQIRFTHPATSQEYNNRSSIVQYLLNAITDEAKSAIESLELGGNSLKSRLNFEGFSNLTNLDLHNNHLITPPDLSHTPKLITLNLSKNNITIAPFRLHTLLALKILNLENNPIQSLVPWPAHLADLEVIGINAKNIYREPRIDTIEKLRHLLINSPIITRAYPDARIREHFINSFIGNDIGSIIEAGNPLGQWTIEDNIIQAIKKEQQEQERKTAPIGVIQREFYDTKTSDSREPKFFTAYSFNELKKKRQNELEKMEQELKNTGTPETSIIAMLREYGLNPATFNLNKMGIKTPVLFLTAPPRSLSESWRYWSTRGISLDQFLELLQSGDQITSQDFTVPQFVAVDFLRDVGLTEQNSNELLSPHTKQDFVEFNESLIIKLKELLGSKTTSQTTEPIASSKEPEQQKKSGAERPSKRRRIE